MTGRPARPSWNDARMIQPPPLTVTIPHRLGKAEAQARIRRGFGGVRAQLHGLVATIDETWTGDRMDFTVRALGQTVTGHLDIADEQVRVELVLPWLLARLAHTIQARLGHEGTRMLGKG